MTQSSPDSSDTNKPINTPRRKLKVVCVGAGASGLLVAYKLQRHFDDFELTIYEKNTELTGTWFENRYPGCACDVPAHIYTYTFEPKTDWSGMFAGSREISKYFNDFADKYELRKYVTCQHLVTSAEWDDSQAVWRVGVQNQASGQTIDDWCHVLINCSGGLNNWKYPDIPGLHSFKGEMCHSAQWNDSINLKGKSVGLIGNGSSGIQILPAILPDVSKVTAFYRGPTWITPGALGDEESATLKFSQEEIDEWKSDPEAHLAFRKDLEDRMNRLFPLFIKDSEEQNVIREMTVESMKEKITDAELVEKLIPKWSVGCRRLTPGHGYLQALGDPKTTVAWGGINRIVEDGLVTESGQHHKFDVLLLATGFNTSSVPRFKLRGRGGHLLSDVWKNHAEAYLGYAIAGFPNYFMSLGPNCPIGNGSVLVSIEAQIACMIEIMGKYQRENLKSFEVSAEACRDLNDHKDKFMERTVWIEDCNTWYRGGTDKSKVTAVWPGSQLHYLETLSRLRWEDWKLEHNGNRFAYLGNGFSTVEANDMDFAHYITNKDTSPIDPSLKRPLAKL